MFVSKVELAQALRDVPYHPRSFVLPKESDKFEETVSSVKPCIEHWPTYKLTHKNQ